MVKKTFLIVGLVLLLGATTALADIRKPLTDRVPENRKPLDVVIALDVSNSMDGLISSAKQRLWDIVNELGSALPLPDLRVAILTYGNPNYGRETGYVKINVPFTRDLDAVSEALFALRTNGGDEYVSRVVTRAVDSLEWSSHRDGMRLIFVAGNEGAAQDPLISYQSAAKNAAKHDVVINTIFCGNSSSNIIHDWRNLALLTDGSFNVIDQNAAAEAGITTPWDDQLLILNQQLNSTYISFGALGARKKMSQARQDNMALGMSKAAAASRVVTKGGKNYRNSAWDLVDRVKEGKSLADIKEEDLPSNMANMTDKEKLEYVEKTAAKRKEIQGKIAELNKKRSKYIKEQRKQKTKGPKGLDEALIESIHTQAAKKGFSFKNQ